MEYRQTREKYPIFRMVTTICEQYQEEWKIILIALLNEILCKNLLQYINIFILCQIIYM